MRVARVVCLLLAMAVGVGGMWWNDKNANAAHQQGQTRKKWKKQCAGYHRTMEVKKKHWARFPGSKINEADMDAACLALMAMVRRAADKGYERLAGNDPEDPTAEDRVKRERQHYYLMLMNIKEELFNAFPKRRDMAAPDNAALYIGAIMLMDELRSDTTVEYLVESSSEYEDDDEF
eukprot:TRINITY_DN25508_c0_g1_i1.p1 TRINITY_DN25508_c0_g1~~TRINITY_DN25508_c0_g1_i1.p1  ORF type:complete len:177 (+),score=56.54 TRINITY_DN25508_c0_g1_i1:57-587(+)